MRYYLMLVRMAAIKSPVHFKCLCVLMETYVGIGEPAEAC